MGRIGAFRASGPGSPRQRSPVVAIVVTFAVTIAVTLGLAWL